MNEIQQYLQVLEQLKSDPGKYSLTQEDVQTLQKLSDKLKTEGSKSTLKDVAETTLTIVEIAKFLFELFYGNSS